MAGSVGVTRHVVFFFFFFGNIIGRWRHFGPPSPSVRYIFFYQEYGVRSVLGIAIDAEVR